MNEWMFNYVTTFVLLDNFLKAMLEFSDIRWRDGRTAENWKIINWSKR